MKEAEETEQLRSFCYSRALDDDQSSIPATKDTLGGKGWSLVEMTKLGLPVPKGFILTTDAWREWQTQQSMSVGLKGEIAGQLERLEKRTGKTLGDPQRPLFVSIRSGAPVSMPGAMITLLNVGLNDDTVETLSKEIGSQNAWKSYLEMMIHLGHQAYGIDREKLHQIRIDSLARYGAQRVSELPVGELQAMTKRVKTIFRENGCVFPEDPKEQIRAGVVGVFRSWESPEAVQFRKQHGIPESLGTAAIVQEIVWGLKEEGGAGVLLTSNIQTGEAVPLVAYAKGKQGTAVVSERGTHGEQHIEDLPIPEEAKDELRRIVAILEERFPMPQDVEFTFDGANVWMLQTRDVPLQPAAHYRVLMERISKGLLSESSAMRQMTVLELQSLLLPPLDPYEVEQKRRSGDILAEGTPISLGNASGVATGSLEEAQRYPDQRFILVLPSISLPIMIDLMDHERYKNIVGVVAGNGGIGSHIARVGTRVGEYMPIIFSAKTTPISPGELLTVDGGTGEVFRGLVPRVQNGKATLLTEEEYKHIRLWYEMRIANPWRYVTTKKGIDVFEQQAQEARDRGMTRYQSPKAQVQEVINTLIPEDIRMGYTVVKAKEQERTRRLLKEILARGNHATLRTCYTPDRQGKAPWTLFTNNPVVDRFFDDPAFEAKYGGYLAWKEDPELTELLVGEIPKDKLSEDLALQAQHASWTVTCTELGDVIMQVRPHTAHLRGHEEASADDLITYRIIVDPAGTIGTRWTDQNIGDHLTDDRQAQAVTRLVLEHILSWWDTYEMPKRLAATSHVYPLPAYATVVLEGQARVDGNDWCRIYSMKIDKMEG